MFWNKLNYISGWEISYIFVRNFCPRFSWRI